MLLAEVTTGWQRHHLRVPSFLAVVAQLALFLSVGRAEHSGTDSSTCGHDSIPYALGVDAQGKLELSCDTPSCFGDNSDAAQEGSSRRVGRLEEMDTSLKKAIDNHSPTTTGSTPSPFVALMRRRLIRDTTHSNYAECSGKLADAVCSAADEWTGGVAEVNNGTHIFLQMECCTYAGLSQAAELKSVVLKPGQRFIGGEVVEGGKMVAFDLVKELRKNVSATNEVSYVVNIYRMLCTGTPRSKTTAGTYRAALSRPRLPSGQTRPHRRPDNDAEDNGEVEENLDAVAHTQRLHHRLEEYGDVESTRHHHAPRGEVAVSPRRYELALRRMHRLKQASGRFPIASRRRQVYRPVLMGDDEYAEDYDDSFDMVPPYPRRRRPGQRGDGYRASRLRFAEERLWPAFSSYSVGMGGKPRVYGNGAYEPESQIPLKTDDGTTAETAATAAIISSPSTASVDLSHDMVASGNTPGEQRDLVGPPGISAPSINYVTLVPSSPSAVAHPSSPPLTLQGYPTVNTYIPPPPLPQPVGPLAYPLPPASSQSSYQQPAYQQPSYSGGGGTSCSSCPNGGSSSMPHSCSSTSSSYDLASSSSSSSSPGCCCNVHIVPDTGYSPAYQQAPGYTPAYQTEYQNQNPYYYTTSGSNLNGAFSALQCFSGDTAVETSEGRKRVDQLAVGDMVMSIDQSMISFSPVVMFLHRKPKEIAKFIKISTVDGTRLKLTGYHLIYMTECGAREQLKLVPARTLRVGQCVHTTSSGNSGHLMLRAARIVRIEEVEDSGIYAPLTANGDIVVNGMLASCHSNMAMQTLQQTFFEWWRKLNVFVSFLLPANEHSTTQPAQRQGTVEDEDGDLPLGVKYLVTVMDTLIPIP